MGIVPDELIKEIESVLQACMPQLEFACLYGFCARGGTCPFSDIDIGTQVPEDPDILTLGDVTGRLESAMGRPVDILLLRGLPERDPELAFRVATEGTLITEQRRHRAGKKS
jgi:predicted nucleotidyltransferase